jgi:hypothetical protein
MTEDMSTADIAGRRPDDERASAGSATAQRPRGESSDEPVADRGSNDMRAKAAEPPRRSALLEESDSGHFRARWSDVQTHFVDGPREAVQDADALVAELMQHLATTFAEERASLERQWTRGEDVSTEDLRIALTRYRSFFDRLLEA